MISCLIAYDADGNVVATLDHMVVRDVDGNVVGLIDFAAHEAAGGEHLDIWVHSAAAGSKVWPEWLGSRAHEFRVELVGPPGGKHIGALVHRQSGHRRGRAEVEAAIAQVIAEAGDEPADIRHIVGGPDRPLPLDADGRTRSRAKPGHPRFPVIPRDTRP